MKISLGRVSTTVVWRFWCFVYSRGTIFQNAPMLGNQISCQGTHSWFPAQKQKAYNELHKRGIQVNMSQNIRKCASDQPALSCSLIRIFIGSILDSQGCKSFSCTWRTLWSDCVHVQTDLSSLGIHVWNMFSHIVASTVYIIMKTCLFKYIENSIIKNWLFR